MEEKETGHILVADDNRVNRMKLSRNLEQQGHTVETAENGQEALEMMHDKPFDVLLLDILMPDMDGYELLERIKGKEELRHIPVIMISAIAKKTFFHSMQMLNSYRGQTVPEPPLSRTHPWPDRSRSSSPWDTNCTPDVRDNQPPFARQIARRVTRL